LFFNYSVVDILIAVIIDFILGDPYWFPHPVIYIGKLISFLEKHTRKLYKSPKGLKVGGGVIVIIVCLLCFALPFFSLYIFRNIPLAFHLINIFILWTTIAATSLRKAGMKVYYALKSNNIEKSRKYLSYIVGRDTRSLSVKEIIRADVETISENTSDGILAPLFYAMLGGAPLAMLYKGVNTMDSMLGYMNDKYINIGYFPAKIDDLFNLIPARITGILICLLAPITRGNIYSSLRIMIRDRKNHKSPNCGYPEAATAGALNIQLGGTNVYFGEKVYKPTIGNNNVELSEKHIVDSIKLMYGAEILFLVMYLVLKVLIGR
jgi:adenosylcobinamide-phosphate synthase